MDILALALGIAAALGGAQLLVAGGVSLAARLGISTLVVGAVVIGFGTSTPELAVNVSSALSGQTGLAIGNILGSNMFNICLVLGIVALISPMSISEQSRSKDLPMCVISALMVGICGNQLYLDHIQYHELQVSHGLIFLIFFYIFMKYVWREAASGKAHHEAADRKNSAQDADGGGLSLTRSILYVAVGLALLVAGGEFIVDGATGIARTFEVSERLIGLLIVGPGTSVPELVASIVAARKKQADMVIGNVLGSNIFNVFFTLGITALIHPVPLDLSLNQVVVINFAVTLFLALFAWLSPKKEFGRGVGAVVCAAYVGYVALSLLG
jgi:cation:H+ antiporter